MPAQKTTKEAIIVQALQLFRRQGYHATSMTDLANACGLHKANFYHYFAGKEALMQAVFEAVREYVDARIVACLKDETLSPPEKLEAFGRRFRRLFASPEQGGCFQAKYFVRTMTWSGERERT